MNLQKICMLSLMICCNHLFAAGNQLQHPQPQRTRQLHHVKLSFGENVIPGVTVLNDDESPAPTGRKSVARIDQEANVVRKLSPSPQATSCWARCCKTNQISRIN